MTNDEVSTRLLIEIRDVLAELLALSKSKRAASQPAENIATDDDLDSQYGDPKSKFKPRDWTGEWAKNQRYSESDPAMLDLLAIAHDGFYDKKLVENDPKARYERMAAARARGWARRLRAGWKPQSERMDEGRPGRW